MTSDANITPVSTSQYTVSTPNTTPMSSTTNTTVSSAVTIANALSTIQRVYGPNCNIYKDVFQVQPNASQIEIREAFFCHRYDIYQRLSGDGPITTSVTTSRIPQPPALPSGPLTQQNETVQLDGAGNEKGGKQTALSAQERKSIEDRMDAISSAFRILSDPNRRADYDAFMSNSSATSDAMKNSQSSTPTASTSTSFSPDSSPSSSPNGKYAASALMRRRGAGGISRSVFRGRKSKSSNSFDGAVGASIDKTQSTQSTQSALSGVSGMSGASTQSSCITGLTSVALSSIKTQPTQSTDSHDRPDGRGGRMEAIETGNSINVTTPQASDGAVGGEANQNLVGNTQGNTQNVLIGRDGESQVIARNGSNVSKISSSVSPNHNPIWTTFDKHKNSNFATTSHGSGHGQLQRTNSCSSYNSRNPSPNQLNQKLNQPVLNGFDDPFYTENNDAVNIKLPAKVDNLNAREQMLYKNQVLQHNQRQHIQNKKTDGMNGRNGGAGDGNGGRTRSRLSSRYETDDRDDWFVGTSYRTRNGGKNFENDDNEDVDIKKNHQNDKKKSSKYGSSTNRKTNLGSPTGVDQFIDSTRHSKGMFSSPNHSQQRKGVKSDVSNSNEKRKHNSNINYPAASSNQDDGRDNHHDNNASSFSNFDESVTYAESITIWDEDTTTYCGETLTLEETTVGESTFGTSTHGTYDDQTYHTEDEITNDGTSVGTDHYSSGINRKFISGSNKGRYEPSHKKGNVPEPILKSSSRRGSLKDKNGTSKSKISINSNENDTNTNGRRVTIHAHRGRGESPSQDPFNAFSDAACPFPSFNEIKEEVTGTYNDASSAMNQVLHAFVISPDDIDRMADKIRDAAVELTENYQWRVNENVEREVRGAQRTGGSSSAGRGGIPIDKAFSTTS